MEINRNTKLTDILAEYPWLPDELIKLDGIFSVIKTPFGKIIRRNATTADAVEKTGLKEDVIISELKKMIESHG